MPGQWYSLFWIGTQMVPDRLCDGWIESPTLQLEEPENAVFVKQPVRYKDWRHLGSPRLSLAVIDSIVAVSAVL